MTENEKNSTDDTVEQKGRAEDEQTQKPIKDAAEAQASTDNADKKADTTERSDKETAEQDDKKLQQDEDEKTEVKPSDAEKDETTSTVAEKPAAESDDDSIQDDKKKGSTDKSSHHSSHCHRSEFQTEIREQIENCKFEIISSLQESVHTELQEVTDKQVRKIERRRKAGVVVRDIIILILAMIIGYFGYCLYDAKYFDFMQPNCAEQACDETKDEIATPEPEVVKDTAWYQQQYGYLFRSLQTNLNADKISAYYLYSDDRKVDEIPAEYLLAMAYNRLNSNTTYDSAAGIVIPASDLRTAFVELFGNADNFSKQNFTYDCTDFKYSKDLDSFTADSVLCAHNANRQIVEEVDQIYEEGNVLYFLTTAAVFDQGEQSFYNFDNLFKVAAKNVTKEDLAKYSSLLNHYQYQFKKVNDRYYFSGVVKLD